MCYILLWLPIAVKLFEVDLIRSITCLFAREPWRRHKTGDGTDEINLGQFYRNRQSQ